jgi:tRNA nucleotidyltransferase (CCA-adding enzyme)
MDLILTHENADFDAVAAQLAAHKLTPSARPVLPRRLNRNVRHFLTLYWDELPFAHTEDLPREPVELVLVVDTQNVQSLRGMDEATRIHIIDHHPPGDDLKPEWQITTEPLGAITTLLCERLQAAGEPLSVAEATLLLLGVYEDTGSLTYGTTTPRDARIAAWLMEQGASLDVLSDFLHHALTDDQRELYDRLLENLHIHDIEGYSVALTSASAPDLVEEVSTLAHKLRDLLKPDALVVLVDLGRHIQLIGRSTVDAVDVARLAERFGGGGHARAAAAIVRGRSLAEAERAVLAALPDIVKPGVTVADLMSHGVQTLSPDTRARDAAAKMRRYGHEGYPVAEQGRIVGLLTRRAVDRAMGHGLSGVRVEQIMDAGTMSVMPGDSVSRLRQVMMESGWGQVPVVDDAGQIIGVVTRTDLIRLWERPAPEHIARQDIERLLDQALPPALMALVRHMGRLAEEMSLGLHVVGGFVRDLLLGQPLPIARGGQPGVDIDFVVEGDAIALVRRLRDIYGGETRSHKRFGTGKWLLDEVTWANIAGALAVPIQDPAALPAAIDFVSARTEFYEHPTALPTVERGSIKLDLHRRDFTINTLAIRLDPHNFGGLLDFWGGERDLRQGMIRVLHSLSFIDDPTRILRAARLEQRLGFRIEARTEELIGHALPLLERVSGDRVRHEIEQIFLEPRPEDALCRLARLGALEAIQPGLTCGEWLRAAYRATRYVYQKPAWPTLADLPDLMFPYFALLTYHLPPDALRAICKRLKVRRRTVEDLEGVQALHAQMDALAAPSSLSALDARLSFYNDRVLLTTWAAAPRAGIRCHIVEYAARLRYVSPHADGETLKEMGLKPGPHLGEVLRRLREAWLDGEVTNGAEERALLARLIGPGDTA